MDISGQGVTLPVEGTMLWSMRIWVIGLHYDIQSEARIQQIMARLGAEDAAYYLGEFMAAVAQGAKRRIEIHCACHPHLEPDEYILLNVLSLAQGGRLREALQLVRGLVRDDAARAVLRSAEALGTELALADQFLQALGPDASAPRRRASGPATIH